MEKIKINDKSYDIQAIEYVYTNVLKIVFNSDIPTLEGDFDLLTNGDEVCASFKGYTNVLKTDNKTVWLAMADVEVEQESTENTISVIETDISSRLEAIEQGQASISEALVEGYEARLEAMEELTRLEETITAMYETRE